MHLVVTAAKSKTASARLRNAVRNHDMVARFGGDEFVVLMEHVSDRGELHDVAQRILDALHEPIVVAGSPAKVGASVGIATASGPDDDPDALIRNADAAMYQAKEHGRGRYEFFRPDARGQVHRTLCPVRVRAPVPGYGASPSINVFKVLPTTRRVRFGSDDRAITIPA